MSRRLCCIMTLTILLGGAWKSSDDRRPIARPDFSGTWVASSSEPLVPFGPQAAISQDSAAISLPQNGQVVAIRLDAETQYTTTTVRGDTWSHRVETRWIQDALLIIETTIAPIGTWEDSSILSFESADANVLTVVSIRTPKTNKGTMITRVDRYRRR